MHEMMFHFDGESTGRYSKFPFIPTRGMKIELYGYKVDTIFGVVTDVKVIATRDIYNPEKYSLRDPSLHVYVEIISTEPSQYA